MPRTISKPEHQRILDNNICKMIKDILIHIILTTNYNISEIEIWSQKIKVGERLNFYPKSCNLVSSLESIDDDDDDENEEKTYADLLASYLRENERFPSLLIKDEYSYTELDPHIVAPVLRQPEPPWENGGWDFNTADWYEYLPSAWFSKMIDTNLTELLSTYRKHSRKIEKFWLSVLKIRQKK